MRSAYLARLAGFHRTASLPGLCLPELGLQLQSRCVRWYIPAQTERCNRKRAEAARPARLLPPGEEGLYRSVARKLQHGDHVHRQRAGVSLHNPWPAQQVTLQTTARLGGELHVWLCLALPPIRSALWLGPLGKDKATPKNVIDRQHRGFLLCFGRLPPSVRTLPAKNATDELHTNRLGSIATSALLSNSNTKLQSLLATTRRTAQIHLCSYVQKASLCPTYAISG